MILRIFSGGAIIVFGGGRPAPPIPPPTPPPEQDQSAVERALGLPQVFDVVVGFYGPPITGSLPEICGMVVSYQGVLKSSMGVPANELDQKRFP